jgi:hypothetical protein
MTDANLAKPRSFETKDLPHGYAPAPVPEFHQQTRDPGYANSEGPDGDEPQEWDESDAAAGKFAEPTAGTDKSGSPADEEKKTSPRGGGKATTGK